MPTGQRNDPFSSYNFLLEIEGITRASFQECSGLDSEVEMKEYREGGDNINMRKLPGLAKYSNISLKRGVTDDRDLYDWHMEWLKGGNEAQRRSGSLVSLNHRGDEVARWNFYEAWPTKWTGPTFNAESSELAIEQFDLAIERLERD